ncbi:MAG TPA: hypothetical protein VD838_06015 [Anaeromyxobacteraceae bacterium]|nr:hypothetical protein [Anaeromyxobacteraceae bacterium]
MREEAAIARELSGTARRRASTLHALSQARLREAEVCPQSSVDILKRYSELAEREAHICEQEADTFEAEAVRADAEAEAAERRAAGGVVSITEGGYR